eukprot:TRINITY_DN8972_c0_g1_i2.p1 TRINITY_DN8972_c0_g1~~TRINITY_DN8972_c0_g1_i2.p1  ORF type:complete len:361 (-),score=56.12 TRINITY_DN8972_c0_g1_i2:88-1170(-)
MMKIKFEKNFLLLFTFCFVAPFVFSQEFTTERSDVTERTNTTEESNATEISNSTVTLNVPTVTATPNVSTTQIKTTTNVSKTTVVLKPISTTENSLPSTEAAVKTTTKFPLQPTRPRPTTTPKPPCLTKDGPVTNAPCKFPFIFEGREHTYCTKQEWDNLWCATDTDTEGHFIDGQWGECGPDCVDDGPLRCYYKYALADTTPQLRYCRQQENLCILAELRHEDGSWYRSQYCSNTTLSDWWNPGNTCQYGEEGGYQCACDYNGCNFDEHTVGYFPLKDRLMPIFIVILMAAIFFLCCMCIFKCCCNNKNNRHQPKNPASGKWTEGEQNSRRSENKKRAFCFFIYLSVFVFSFAILCREF